MKFHILHSPLPSLYRVFLANQLGFFIQPARGTEARRHDHGARITSDLESRDVPIRHRRLRRHPTLLDHSRFHPLERKEVEVHDPKASRLWVVGVLSREVIKRNKQKLLGVWVGLVVIHKVGYKKGLLKPWEGCWCLIMSEGGRSQ